MLFSLRRLFDGSKSCAGNRLGVSTVDSGITGRAGSRGFADSPHIVGFLGSAASHCLSGHGRGVVEVVYMEARILIISHPVSYLHCFCS